MPSRRVYLRLMIAGAVGGLAGCNLDGPAPETETRTADQQTPTATPIETLTPTPPPAPTETSTPKHTATLTPTSDPIPTPISTSPPGKLAVHTDLRDLFGASIAVDGETALIGMPTKETPDEVFTGSVYVFERTDRTWVEQTTLASEDGSAGDSFGASVALGDETALVGAFEDDMPSGESAGSVYVFERSGGEWSQRAKLTPHDGDSEDRFGTSIALDGERALIGAPGDEGPVGKKLGSAYIFNRSDGGWVQQAKLQADNDNSLDYWGDRFGSSVALDGTSALIGAPWEEDPNRRKAGAAFVFERSGGQWKQVAKLASDNGDPGDRFGRAVALTGKTALIGAHSGVAYVFERSNGRWIQHTTLSPDDTDRWEFGSAVALNGDRALIGAPDYPQFNSAGGDHSNPGSAYVFSRVGEQWTQHLKLSPGTDDSPWPFGKSVALAGGWAFVGAADLDYTKSGSVYVFLTDR